MVFDRAVHESVHLEEGGFAFGAVGAFFGDATFEKGEAAVLFKFEIDLSDGIEDGVFAFCVIGEGVFAGPFAFEVEGGA